MKFFKCKKSKENINEHTISEETTQDNTTDEPVEINEFNGNANTEEQNEHTNKSASAKTNPEIDENGRAIHKLRVSSLYKTFGRKTVVKGIDFSMATGEILGLLGPNGAGKTTTFYMIVGFYQPSAGDIFLNEEQITGLPMFKRARLGISYLPQEPSVFKKLTVEENIWSILETRNDLSKHEKKQRLEELIDEFAIARIRKQPAFTLSGGERRRTEIARSLAIEPKFLLLDEPFAGIDPICLPSLRRKI